MGYWYCTREDVKSALDSKETARNNAQVDRAIEAASRSLEGLLHRKFYPTTATRYVDWPLENFGPASWRIWLEQDEVLSLTQVMSGTTIIPANQYFLEPANSGPPYDRLELNRNTSVSFGQNSTPQRDITIVGDFGASNTTVDVGALGGTLVGNGTTLNVPDGSRVGTGTTLVIEQERITVTRKTYIDSVQVLSSSVANQNAATAVPTLGAATFNIGEIVYIGTEKMLVEDIIGTTLVVQRAWDGSVLAAHNTSDPIYVNRGCTVTRGQYGTIAAQHNGTVEIYKLTPPGLIRSLCIAEALSMYLAETAGYARVVGSGEQIRKSTRANDTSDIRLQAYQLHGRKARMRVV